MCNSTVLSNIWRVDYYLLVWYLNKNCSSFTGKELKAFWMNIPEIIKFTKANFVANSHLSDMCDGLDIWHYICPFLSKSRIIDKVCYEQEIIDFENNVKLLYQYGSMVFLTKVQVGDEDTFYMHCLRYYMPIIA